jgi:ubiquinone/menaquinone biosynthesis C-methylase UbiE
MAELIPKIREDFDRIALLSGDDWDHNNHYHDFLLKHIPPHCINALEIGCGTGSFSRVLAKHSGRVLALDLSPNMIQVAKERSKQYPNIDFQIADAMTWEFPADQFDCIVSIATLHHLPMEGILSRIKMALKTKGTMAILDLFQAEGLRDVFTGALAIPLNSVLGLIRNGRLRESDRLQEAWAEHGRNDSYLTLSQIKRVCDSLLPGARVRKHLLWRYSIIWKKPVILEGKPLS